jgi:hypothetical protein
MPPRTGPRAGFLQGFFTGAGLGAILSSASQAGADVRTEVIYVGYLGNGIHLVRNLCNDQVQQVTSLGNQSYLPGTKVTLVNQGAGFGGETILGSTSGQGGGSDVAVSTSVTFGLFPGTPPPVCPVAPSGHSYLGIGDDGAHLYAYKYLGSVYQGRLAKTAYNSLGVHTPHWLNYANRCHDLGDIVLLPQFTDSGGFACFLTWDVAGNSLVLSYPAWDPVADGFVPPFQGPAHHQGSDILWITLGRDSAGGHVYKASAGVAGVVGTNIGGPGGYGEFAFDSGFSCSSAHLFQKGFVFDIAAGVWHVRLGFPGIKGVGAGCQVGGAEGAVGMADSLGHIVGSPLAGADIGPFPGAAWLFGTGAGADFSYSHSPDRTRLIAFPALGALTPSLLDIVVPAIPIDPSCQEGPALTPIPAPPITDGPAPIVVLARD